MAHLFFFFNALSFELKLFFDRIFALNTPGNTMLLLTEHEVHTRKYLF